MDNKKALNATENEYHAAFCEVRGNDPLNFNAFAAREWLVKEYAWAIPTRDAISCIVKHAPRIVEIGAGTGYWAHLLSKAGADVVAYDKEPHQNAQANGKWYDVKKGDEKKASEHYHRALMLCWPPYNAPMAYNALQCFGGKTLIYIGEPRGGCTATDAFHDDLLKNWCLVEDHFIPQWAGIHDRLYIYNKRGT